MPALPPLVTMIVPGRDVAAFAPDALASLRAQTEPRWRALLIDDGSVDGTGDVFAAAASDDDRFLVIRHESSRGLGAARNVGLGLVDTPLLGFLDADDELVPTTLDRMIRTLDETGSDLVAGAYVRSRPTAGGVYTSGRVQPWVAAATSPERRATTLQDHPDASANIVAWSKISRTALWDRLRFPEDVAYEDQIVAQRLYTSARTFDVIPDVTVRWRVRGDGTSITQSKARLPILRDYLAALRGGIRVLQEAGATDAVVARLSLILSMDVPSVVPLAAAHPDPAYRAALESFLDALRALPEYAAARPDPTLAAALSW